MKPNTLTETRQLRRQHADKQTAKASREGELQQLLRNNAGRRKLDEAYQAIFGQRVREDSATDEQKIDRILNHEFPPAKYEVLSDDEARNSAATRSFRVAGGPLDSQTIELPRQYMQRWNNTVGATLGNHNLLRQKIRVGDVLTVHFYEIAWSERVVSYLGIESLEVAEPVEVEADAGGGGQ